MKVIQANLDYLQVKQTKFDVECQKGEAYRKSLELIMVMDARELWIVTKWGKRLEKENASFDVGLHSQANDLKSLLKPVSIYMSVISYPTMLLSCKNN